MKPGSCGFRLDHNISLYTSPTLESGSWVLAAKNILPVDSRPVGIYAVPNVQYNHRTRSWVLWVNYLFNPTSPAGEFAHSRYLTATSSVRAPVITHVYIVSSSVRAAQTCICRCIAYASKVCFYCCLWGQSAAGPFKVSNDNVSTLHWPPGDYSVWPDKTAGDSSAYIIYTSISTHQMTVERLTDDWLGSTMSSSGVFGDKGVEAPVLFRRGLAYYALFDKECCYCPQGSGVVAYTAQHPLGPWTRHKQIGRYPSPPAPPPCPPIKDAHQCKQVNCSWVNRGTPPVGHCENPPHPALGASVSQAQQRYVFWYPPMPTKQRATAGIAQTLVWAGNRWQSAPDRLKDHDFNTWLPLRFGANSPTAPPLPLQMQWLDNFTLS